jgi:hypothetical protein
MNWLICFVGEAFCGALEEISMSLNFRVRSGKFVCFCPVVVEFSYLIFDMGLMVIHLVG